MAPFGEMLEDASVAGAMEAGNGVPIEKGRQQLVALDGGVLRGGLGPDGVQNSDCAPGREHLVGLCVTISVLDEVHVNLGGAKFAGRGTARVVGQALLLIDEADCIARLGMVEYSAWPRR